jgi:hypothetical protein
MPASRRQIIFIAISFRRLIIAFHSPSPIAFADYISPLRFHIFHFRHFISILLRHVFAARLLLIA